MNALRQAAEKALRAIEITQAALNEFTGREGFSTVAADLRAALVAPEQAAQPTIDYKINKRNCKALLEQLMAECELVGYEKAIEERATPQPVPAALTDEQIESIREDCGIAWTGDFYRCESKELGDFVRAIERAHGIGAQP